MRPVTKIMLWELSIRDRTPGCHASGHGTSTLGPKVVSTHELAISHQRIYSNGRNMWRLESDRTLRPDSHMLDSDHPIV
jgi:hypothetical protein